MGDKTERVCVMAKRGRRRKSERQMETKEDVPVSGGRERMCLFFRHGRARVRQGQGREAGSLTACKSGCRLEPPAAYHCLFTVSPAETPSNKKISLLLPFSPSSISAPPSSHHQLPSLCISLPSLSPCLISPPIQICSCRGRCRRARHTHTRRAYIFIYTLPAPYLARPSPRPLSVLCLEAMSDGACCLSVAPLTQLRFGLIHIHGHIYACTCENTQTKQGGKQPHAETQQPMHLF